MKNRLLSAKLFYRIGTWNVQTLYQARKLALLEREFESYKLNILGISEVRWPGQGKVPLGDKTLLYSGHETEHARCACCTETVSDRHQVNAKSDEFVGRTMGTCRRNREMVCNDSSSRSYLILDRFFIDLA